MLSSFLCQYTVNVAMRFASLFWFVKMLVNLTLKAWFSFWKHGVCKIVFLELAKALISTKYFFEEGGDDAVKMGIKALSAD